MPFHSIQMLMYKLQSYRAEFGISNKIIYLLLKAATEKIISLRQNFLNEF